MRSHAQDTDVASADLGHEEHIHAAQGDCAVDVKKIASQNGLALARRNCRQVVRPRCGAGGIRRRFRIRCTVDAPTMDPRLSSSPWIRF